MLLITCARDAQHAGLIMRAVGHASWHTLMSCSPTSTTSVTVESVQVHADPDLGDWAC